MTGTTQDTEEAAFSALEQALQTQDVAFELDLQRLCHPSCPLPFDHLKTRIAYGYLVLAIALGVGLWMARIDQVVLWSVLAAFTLVFWVAIPPVAERRFIRGSIVSYVMEEPERLAKLWRYGGLSLIAADGRRVTAPKEDWRKFVLAAKG
jgi:hypothetical protein